MSKKATYAGFMIDIVPPTLRYSRWGKFKTVIWNFILPPHIRLRFDIDQPTLDKKIAEATNSNKEKTS